MSEFIVDLSNVEKTSDRFKMLFSESIPIGREIVRCRDCAKWHHIDTEDGIRYGECGEWKRADSYCVPATNEDGFCAWAKRDEDGRTYEKALITIALQLVRYHYDKDDAGFDETCIELERWCYGRGKVDLAEFAMACRCPETSFVPMGGDCE